MRGWLGSDTPEHFVEVAEAEPMPCHSSIDYEADDWQEQVEEGVVCVGALTYLRNRVILPRDPEHASMVREVDADRARVFASKQEFIQHHRPLGKSSGDAGP